MTNIINPCGSGLKQRPSPAYDIYWGRANDNPTWVDSVDRLGDAYELMTKVAATSPGTYFIVCARTGTVRGSIDTSTYGSQSSQRFTQF